MIPESIHDEVRIDASPARVWTVLTEAEHLAAWFAFDGAEIDLRPGGAMVFRWKEEGVFHARIEAIEPQRKLSFRWALLPDVAPTEGNANLVEFTLTADGAGTLLRVDESGFRELHGSDDDRAGHVRDNRMGWEGALSTLVKHLDASAA
ncbi:hypothetical protein TL08_10040 [Actinoalloteichus hymeniacidonis]|uniref:Activator of Hsp90 ATPase homologue 1/2-like C-terminal domain-containing protein n=2 Tax=Actinoalloteichus hymeniacidonis TaxID=340345 RepID=A0AAC9HP25_9PSEU|nr:hypothetical protein TL08_10040 [Actinoalloteichus hymeniacidonis]